MIDSAGRKIDYLRISVTDRCNLRCRYCMPPEGVKNLGHEAILTYSEIVRIAKIMADLGIRKVKITGGEPLVRLGIEELIEELNSIKAIEQVTLTTNGILLSQKIFALYKAGIRNINISLDTLDRKKYEELTGYDALEDVKASIDACLDFQDINLKLNCLALADNTRDDFARMASLAADKPIDVRFIEVMPIGMGKSEKGVDADDILHILEDKFGKSQKVIGKRGNGPAQYFSFERFDGKIGFISPMSHKFCSGCNRARLTADGFFKPCLAYDTGVDLKSLMRLGVRDQELAEHILKAVNQKNIGHSFGTETAGGRSMWQIGG